MKRKLPSKAKNGIGLVLKLQNGGKPSFEDYYRTIPREKNDTTNYNLREAYNELPYNIMRDFATSNNVHLPDTYKLPNHPTFSVESKYYKPGMKAGYWDGDTYIPLDSGQLPPKLQNGGRAPIITHNPNDPRIRAYQDSLDLYNWGQLDAQSAINLNAHQYRDATIPNTGRMMDARERLDRMNGQYPSSTAVTTTHSDGTNTSHQFARPVQPYMPEADDNYDRQHPPIYLTDSRDPRLNQYTEAGNQYRYMHPKLTPFSLDKRNIENTQQQGDFTKYSEDNNKLPLPHPDWFSRPQQGQETGGMEYFDKEGKKLELGGNVKTAMWEIIED